MSLQNLSLAQLSRIDQIVNKKDRQVKHKDKKTALKAIGRASKQDIVRGLLIDGVTVAQIMEMLGVSKAYARDIISKLVMKGVVVEKGEGDVFRLAIAA